MRNASEVKRDIVERLGMVPCFFQPALEDAQVLESLWQQTVWCALDNPAPDWLKKELLVVLAVELEQAAVLIGHGCMLELLKPKPAELSGLLQRKGPEDWHRILQASKPLAEWPSAGSDPARALAAAAAALALERNSRPGWQELQRVLGPARLHSLERFTDWMRQCAHWFAAHPDCAREVAQCCPPEIQRELAKLRPHGESADGNSTAEDALSSATEHLRSILDHFPAVVFVKDLKGRYVAANGRFRQLLDRDESPVGKTDYDLFPAHVAEACRASDVRVLMEQKPAEIEETFDTPSGRRLYSSVKFPLSSTSGKPCGLCGVSIDVTRQHSVEEELRTESIYRQAIESTIPSGIIAVDMLGRQTYVNAEFCRMVGWSAEELIAAAPPFVYWPAEDLEALTRLFNQTLRGEKGVRHETARFCRKNGDRFDVSLVITPLCNARGTIVGWLGAISDVTAQQRSEVRAAVLMKFMRQLSSAMTRSEAGRAVSEATDELFGWDACLLNLYLPQRDLIYPIVNIGTVAGERVTMEAPEVLREPSAMVRRVLAFGAELVRHDEPASGSSLLPFEQPAPAAASMMNVPVCHRNGGIGVLSIRSHRRGAYTPEDIDVLQSLADLCGGALERIRASDALLESESRLRLASRAASLSFWTYEPADRKLTWFPELERVFGLPSGTFKGGFEESIKFVHPEDRAKIVRTFEAAVVEPVEFEVEFRYSRADGQVRWMVGRGRAYSGEEGAPVRLAGVAMDITERKQREQRERAFSALGQKLSSAATHEEAAQIIADTADDLLGWDAYFMNLYDAELDALVAVINIDTVDGKRVAVPSVVEGKPPGPGIRRVIERGAEIILRETPEFSDRTPYGDTARPSASLLFVPLRHSGETTGVLSVQSYAPSAYTPRDLELLQTLADHCAGAIERIRAAEALRQSEEQFRTLCESSPVGIFRTDAEGRCIYNNTTLLGIAQRRFEDALGDRWLKAVHPDDRAAVRQSWNTVLAKRRVWRNEHRLLLPNGELRWVRALAKPFFAPDGKMLGYVGTVEDITERRRAEQALRESQERHQLVNRATNDVIWDWDVPGDELYWNDAILRTFGYTRQELGSSVKHRYERIHPEDRRRVVDSLRAAIESDAVQWSAEYRFRRKDGSYAVYFDRGFIARDESGKAYRVIGSMVDVTEHKRTEEALQELVSERTRELEESVRSLESFCYSVAHDLRAPLRAVQGLTAVLLEDYAHGFDDLGRDFAQRIVGAAGRMDRMIQDLLDYGRLSHREFSLEPVLLEDRVDEALEAVSQEIHEKKAIITVERPLPQVWGSRAVLTQVVTNLISNALKFVPPGVQPQIRVFAERPGPVIRFGIQDNGIGIQPQHQERIFRVFERLHRSDSYSGTGIGLALVRKGMERMRGSVRVESEPGKGSTFWIELQPAEK